MVTKTGVMSGNKVSHSNRKTRRRFVPNLHDVSLVSAVLGRKIPLKRISAKGLRTIEKKGGFDDFILSTKSSELPKKIRKLKKRVSIKLDGAAVINKYLKS